MVHMVHGTVTGVGGVRTTATLHTVLGVRASLVASPGTGAGGEEASWDLVLDVSRSPCR